MTQLPIQELISGWPVNLRWVQRWSTSRCMRPENVAEHTFFVAFYAMAIAHWAFSNNRCALDEIASSGSDHWVIRRDAFYGRLLTKCLVHDLEEARTGDIHRPFKYSHARLKEKLDEAAEIAMEQLLFRLWPGNTNETSRVLWRRIWSHSKDGSLEGRIVAFADFLSVVSFIWQEGEGASGRLSLDSLHDHFAVFMDTDYDFIRPLVEQTEQLLKDQGLLGVEGTRGSATEGSGEEVREPH